MNLFEAVKDAVPVRAAAEHYGIRAGRGGMACCPFHDDKTPSLKLNEDYFYCFGCGAAGDVIDLTGGLFGLGPRQAAEKLAEDFGVPYDRPKMGKQQRRPSVISRLTAAQEYRRKEKRCSRILCGYYRLLCGWKERYAPQTPEGDWHPLFCEALRELDYTGYLLEKIVSGTLEERALIVRETEKRLDALERRIAGFADAGLGPPHKIDIPGKAKDAGYAEEAAI